MNRRAAPAWKPLFEEEYEDNLLFIERARHYVDAFGLRASEAIVDDRMAGRISHEAGAKTSSCVPLVELERATERLKSFTDLEAVMNEPGFARFAAGIRSVWLRDEPPDQRVALEASLRSRLVTDWHLVAHARAGRHGYEVASGLAERLRHTLLKGLTSDDLRLPHPAICIRVPAQASLSMQGPDGEYQVMEAYVVEHAAAEDRHWRVLINAELPGTDRFMRHQYELPLPPGGELAASIAAADEGVRSTPMSDDRDEEGVLLFEHTDERDASTRFRATFRWLMNVVIYATNDGERRELYRSREAAQLRARMLKLPKGKKREELKQRLRGMDIRKTILLGPSVPLMDAGPGAGGQPLTVRQRVQGHWRHQAHGAGRASRKLIWVEPYWRGPDDGVLPVKTKHRLVEGPAAK